MAAGSVTYTIFITEDGAPKTGLTPGWEYLHALDGTDKSGSAPAISEIGGGWYKFLLTYGTAPFDVDDLRGSIDADAGLVNYERYIPITISLNDLALDYMARGSSHDKATDIVQVQNAAGNNVVKHTYAESEGIVTNTVTAGT